MRFLLAVMDTAKYSYYLGTRDVNQFWSTLFFGYVGVLVMLLLSVSMRNPTSPKSPIPFSWKYFWATNAQRIAGNLILVAVCIRFTPEILGMDVTQGVAFIIGLGSDLIGAQLMKKRKVLFSDDASTVTVITQPSPNATSDTTVTVNNTTTPIPPVDNTGADNTTENKTD